MYNLSSSCLWLTLCIYCAVRCIVRVLEFVSWQGQKFVSSARCLEGCATITALFLTTQHLLLFNLIYLMLSQVRQQNADTWLTLRNFSVENHLGNDSFVLGSLCASSITPGKLKVGSSIVAGNDMEQVVHLVSGIDPVAGKHFSVFCSAETRRGARLAMVTCRCLKLTAVHRLVLPPHICTVLSSANCILLCLNKPCQLL